MTFFITIIYAERIHPPFLSLFEYLPVAGEILARENIEEKDSDSKISQAVLALQEIRNDPENKFMVTVFDEIDDNLYGIPSDRLEVYVEDILRGFTGIAPFLYLPPGIGLSELNNGIAYKTSSVEEFSKECLGTLRLLSSLTEETDIDDEKLSDAEKYVFSCYSLLLLFSKSLDIRCLQFKLNLSDIQERLGIFIFYDRDYNELVNAGYWDKVHEIFFEEENTPKALPENTAPQVRLFTDWLKHPDPAKLALVCKQVFGVKNSRRDYAIMFCLLCENGYILLPEKHRTDFYDSWYSYLEKPFPKNRNYYSINKHIDIIDGLTYLDDTDPYYLSLKMQFKRKLGGDIHVGGGKPRPNERINH